MPGNIQAIINLALEEKNKPTEKSHCFGVYILVEGWGKTA